LTETPLIKVTIFNPQTGLYKFVNALIDTGASMTCIPEKTAQALGLKAVGIVPVSSIGGKYHFNQYIVKIKIKNNVFRNKVVVGIPTPEISLIGWDILTNKPMLFTNILFGEIGHFLEAIPSFKQNTVLILGQDTTEIYRLRAIQNSLKRHGYTGIIVKDIVDIDIQSIEEKVNMLASFCRFIICDNSFPSGHIDELKICAFNRYVTTIFQEKGHGATMMQADYQLDFSFMKTFIYSNIKNIDTTVDDAIKWTEIKIEERRKYFNKLYGWR
jgi:predicted aspartyl protease